jgi:hypothetical protein
MKSEPSPGSVAPSAASRGWSVSHDSAIGLTKRWIASRSPESRMGERPSMFAPKSTAQPEHAAASSSVTRTPVSGS